MTIQAITTADRAQFLSWLMKDEFDRRSDLPAITLQDDGDRARGGVFDVRRQRNV